MDLSRAPLTSLQQELGRVLSAAIDRDGGKLAFARRTGLNRATLYRLLRGENVSTEVLLRTLRGLGRTDLIAQLLAEPEPSPLERLPPRKRNRKPDTHTSAHPQRATSPVARLKLGVPQETE